MDQAAWAAAVDPAGSIDTAGGGNESLTVRYSVSSTERLLNAKTFLATATKECCPARGTLAGHFTRRLSPSPMPGKRIQPQRAYLPLKRSSPRPQFYRGAEASLEANVRRI